MDLEVENRLLRMKVEYLCGELERVQADAKQARVEVVEMIAAFVKVRMALEGKEVR